MMAIETCAWCGRYAGGRCTHTDCEAPVCYERLVPGIPHTSCGRLVDGRLLCPTHQKVAYEQRARDEQRSRQEHQQAMNATAREAARMLARKGFPTSRLGNLEVELRKKRFSARPMRIARLTEEYGRGWLISPGASGGEWGAGTPGTLLTEDGRLLKATGMRYKGESPNQGGEKLTDTGEGAFPTRGEEGSLPLKHLKDLVDGSSSPIACRLDGPP